jgi:hypothetical protein
LQSFYGILRQPKTTSKDLYQIQKLTRTIRSAACHHVIARDAVQGHHKYDGASRNLEVLWVANPSVKLPISEHILDQFIHPSL